MSMISQQRFHVHIGGKKSCCRTLLNSVPQGSIITLLLFYLYMHDNPPTTTKKFVYADDIALLRLAIRTILKLKEFYRKIWVFLVPILLTGDSSVTPLKLFRVCFILLTIELATKLTFKSPVKGYLLQELQSVLVSPLIAPCHTNNTWQTFPPKQPSDVTYSKDSPVTIGVQVF